MFKSESSNNNQFSKLKNLCFVLIFVSVFISWASKAFADQLKKTVAVSRFDNRSGWSGEANLGTGLADQLNNALVESGKFVVIERQTLEDIIGEQDLAASARFAVSKSAQTGKLVPAQILIKGTVTEFQTETSSSGTGIGFAGFSIGGESTKSHVGIILRIIDTTSGQVLDSIRVEEKSEDGGLSLGVNFAGFNFDTEGFEKTPLGQTAQKAIDKAVQKIVAHLENIALTGKIIKVGNESVYSNLGSRNGVSEGDVFNVYSPGEELIDPDTGENLGDEKTKVGTLRVTSVKEKFSKAVMETGTEVKKGYILVQ